MVLTMANGFLWPTAVGNFGSGTLFRHFLLPIGGFSDGIFPLPKTCNEFYTNR